MVDARDLVGPFNFYAVAMRSHPLLVHQADERLSLTFDSRRNPP
jgi:hypothetical protein